MVSNSARQARTYRGARRNAAKITARTIDGLTFAEAWDEQRPVSDGHAAVRRPKQIPAASGQARNRPAPDQGHVMTTYPYTANFDERGVCVLEIECDLDVSVDLSSGEFEMSISAVMVNGVNLLKSSYSAFKAIGLDVIDMAERDPAFVAAVMAREDIVRIGEGYGNPDAKMVRAA